ncbi:N-formimino-L-glutamate deiminase [compost metagenome]
MQIGKLVCVEFDLKAVRLCSIENAGDFIRQEGYAFAKTVNRISQIFSGDSRKHVVNDAGDIGGFIAIHFRR